MVASKHNPILSGDSQYVPDERYAIPTNFSRWQSAPSTALQQGSAGVKISMQDYNLVRTYRTFTCETFPHVTEFRNPWKGLTFDLQFREPHLYHATLAITSAHLRYLQGVSTPSIAEVSHYIKALSSFRENLSHEHTQLVPMKDVPLYPGSPSEPNLEYLETTPQMKVLFPTSVLLVAYMHTSEVNEFHSWLIANFSMMAGTRATIQSVLPAAYFSDFRAAIKETLEAVTQKLYGLIKIGEKMRFPALEALAQPSWRSPSTLQNEPPDTFEFRQSDSEEERNIYDPKYAWVGLEDCPFYGSPGGEMVVSIGALHRLAYIITALETRDPPVPLDCMAAVTRLIIIWPGICVYEILEKLKTRDKRVYMLLAYYYATVVRARQVNTAALNMVDLNWKPPQDDIMKSWWLMRNARLLLRRIVDWLGDEWAPWLEWPLKVLKEEEEAERGKMESIWEPTTSDRPFQITLE
ncbi:hypothetical protein ABW19_dt0207209 [Dactylella cylindrospora]|nr:hypothetical protein ABW19_dt0207209 [Dactylella cylindrospora]